MSVYVERFCQCCHLLTPWPKNNNNGVRVRCSDCRLRCQKAGPCSAGVGALVEVSTVEVLMIANPTPNPGSEEALVAGCTCPVIDNNHGLAPPWPHGQGHGDGWYKLDGCPLHDPATGIGDDDERELVPA